MPVKSGSTSMASAYAGPALSARMVPSPNRASGELGWELAARFQGSGWVAGSIWCATRVWTRIVVKSLVHTFRKSHQLMQPS